MHPKMFGFPVEITKHQWPFNADIDQKEVITLLDAFFSPLNMYHKLYSFYKVTRPDYGLVKSVTVVEAPFHDMCAHYVIRCNRQPHSTQTISLNLPAYQKQRIEQLITTLGDHYPPTLFINTEKYFITLQQFLFYPVCEFSEKVDIVNLLDIVYLASKSRILLDYNHNHWLKSEIGFLYYCDTDYMGNFYQTEYQALEANLNQTMAFLNETNCRLLPSALEEFASVGSSSEDFVEQFRCALEDLLSLSFSNPNLSESLRNKINCLSRVFKKS
ncbi:MAG: hypothetical protein ACFFE8_02855 [Candidatus Heimdallarchaeota archaeon]